MSAMQLATTTWNCVSHFPPTMTMTGEPATFNLSEFLKEKAKFYCPAVSLLKNPESCSTTDIDEVAARGLDSDWKPTALLRDTTLAGRLIDALEMHEEWARKTIAKNLESDVAAYFTPCVEQLFGGVISIFWTSNKTESQVNAVHSYLVSASTDS